MHCGVSVGVKCPQCGTVSPLGSKRCTACGYEFESKPKKPQKKKKSKKSGNMLQPIGAFCKKHAGILLPIAVLLFTLTALILALTVPLTLAVSEEHPKFLQPVQIRASTLLAYFFGGTPAPMQTLESFVGSMTAETLYLRVFADLGAIGYLILFLTALPILLLAAGNLTACGRKTAGKLLRFCGGFGIGCLLGCVSDVAIEKYLTTLMANSVNQSVYTLTAKGTAIALAAVGVLGFLCVLLFYLLHFSKTEPLAHEKGIFDLLWRNRAITSLRNRVVGRRGAKGDKGDKRKQKEEKTIKTTSRFPIYLLLLAAALLFTQALANVASYICFLFLLLMPPVSLLYTLSAKSALTVHMVSDSCTVEKGELCTYEFYIDNHFIFAYPFIKAKISLPQSDSVRCADRTVCLAVSPLSQYRVRNTVSFRFRGTYEIGVRCFYVYDFLGLFCVRVEAENLQTVSVMPRRLQFGNLSTDAVADSAKRTVKSPISYDKLEVSDIREYRSGDALKSIHWKLSSKSEDFIVREYNTGTADVTYVFCDFAMHYPTEPPAGFATIRENVTKEGQMSRDIRAQVLASAEYYRDMNEYLADGVVELTVATVLRELSDGRQVVLFWFDRRFAAGAFACRLTSAEDFDLIFKQFATVPLCAVDDSLSRLSTMADNGESSKQIFVTGSLDRASIADLCRIPGLCEGADFGASEVLLYEPRKRYAVPEERTLYLESCREQLAENGLILRQAYLPESDGKAEAGAFEIVAEGEGVTAHG